jgi:hypothetical protein
VGKEYNTTSDDKIKKFTLNIPLERYVRIIEACTANKPARPVGHWINEAIEARLNTTYSLKQMIQYEVMRHLGEIKAEPVAKRVEKDVSVLSGNTAADHHFHKFPGSIAGLMKNQFVWNLWKKEKMLKKH